jgi:hypothetical protein
VESGPHRTGQTAPQAVSKIGGIMNKIKSQAPNPK